MYSLGVFPGTKPLYSLQEDTEQSSEGERSGSGMPTEKRPGVTVARFPVVNW